MKWSLPSLFVLSFITFNASPSYAVRFHPSVTDQDTLDLGKEYTSVGMVCEKHEDLYNGKLLEVNIKSTATLVTLPEITAADGSLILVSHHAFKNWALLS